MALSDVLRKVVGAGGDVLNFAGDVASAPFDILGSLDRRLSEPYREQAMADYQRKLTLEAQAKEDLARREFALNQEFNPDIPFGVLSNGTLYPNVDIGPQRQGTPISLQQLAQPNVGSILGKLMPQDPVNQGQMVTIDIGGGQTAEVPLGDVPNEFWKSVYAPDAPVAEDDVMIPVPDPENDGQTIMVPAQYAWHYLGKGASGDGGAGGTGTFDEPTKPLSFGDEKNAIERIFTNLGGFGSTPKLEESGAGVVDTLDSPVDFISAIGALPAFESAAAETLATEQGSYQRENRSRRGAGQMAENIGRDFLGEPTGALTTDWLSSIFGGKFEKIEAGKTKGYGRAGERKLKTSGDDIKVAEIADDPRFQTGMREAIANGATLADISDLLVSIGGSADDARAWNALYQKFSQEPAVSAQPTGVDENIRRVREIFDGIFSKMDGS